MTRPSMLLLASLALLAGPAMAKTHARGPVRDANLADGRCIIIKSMSPKGQNLYLDGLMDGPHRTVFMAKTRLPGAIWKLRAVKWGSEQMYQLSNRGPSKYWLDGVTEKPDGDFPAKSMVRLVKNEGGAEGPNWRITRRAGAGRKASPYYVFEIQHGDGPNRVLDGMTVAPNNPAFLSAADLAAPGQRWEILPQKTCPVAYPRG